MPVETVRFERSIHFNDCNTSWVNLNIVSLYKPVSLTKIKVLCYLNVDDLLSRTLLLTIVTIGGLSGSEHFHAASLVLCYRLHVVGCKLCS